MRGWRRCGLRRSPLPFPAQPQNDLTDSHALGAGSDDDFGNRAFVDAFDLHRRLVGFDFGEHIAGFDRITDLDQPFGDGAAFHRR